jgi:hypothetical protein
VSIERAEIDRGDIDSLKRKEKRRNNRKNNERED